MNLLHTLGLMARKEHEAACKPLRERLFDSEQKRIHWQGQSNEMTAKFKRAATDLAAQAEKLARLESLNTILLETNAALRPDAEAMRKKRDADRKRMAGKRGKA